MTLLSEVKEMAIDLMNNPFYYRGITYNMNDMGWSFNFNNNKSRLGLCSRKGGKTIYLSKWVIENSQEDFGTWENTMLHEIAHAIDYEIRGKSSHGYQWQSIALAIGCDGKRRAKVEFDMDTITTKYTMICDSCGKRSPSHKKRRRKVSCGVCSNGVYNENYILRQVQNY